MKRCKVFRERGVREMIFYSLFLGWVPAIAVAQTSETPAPPSATPTGESTSSTVCQAVRVPVTKDKVMPPIFAVCGKKAVVVGEATNFASAWNPALSTLLVVRQQPYRTLLTAVVVDVSGSVRAEDLTLAISRRLAEAGRIQSPVLTVDVGLFEATGAIAVTPMLATTSKVTDAGSALKALPLNLTPILIRVRAATADAALTSK